MIKLKNKSFSKMSLGRRFLRLLKIMAPCSILAMVGRIDFILAVLEANNYLFF